MRIRLFVSLFTIVVCCGSAAATIHPLVLASQTESTRALALESPSSAGEPFASVSSYPWTLGQRTRVMVFVIGLQLQPEDDWSQLTADAEDATHRHYDFKVEYAARVPGQEWLSAI